MLVVRVHITVHADDYRNILEYLQIVYIKIRVHADSFGSVHAGTLGTYESTCR